MTPSMLAVGCLPVVSEQYLLLGGSVTENFSR